MSINRELKMRAYHDAVEIVKSAYGSNSEYRVDLIPRTVQETYEKLLDLIEDAYGFKKN